MADTIELESAALTRCGVQHACFTCAYCGIQFIRHGTALAHMRKPSRAGRPPYCSKSCASKARHRYTEAEAPRNNRAENRSWHAMKARCDNPNALHYARYGGRGISYDPRWESFVLFLQDMGPKPSPEHTLERIDNEKNYSPDNCRWASRHEQARNRGGKRATRMYAYRGFNLCMKDWAIKCGLNPASMQKRLNKGWPLERAFAEAFAGSGVV